MAASRRTAARDTVTVEPAARRTPMPKIGVWSWAFVGFTVAAVIVVIVLGALSEIVLPMLFAAVLAIIFKPLVGVLQRHNLKPTLAAGVVVLGLLLLMAGVVVATVRGVTDQADQIGEVTDEALGQRRRAARRGRGRPSSAGGRPGGHRRGRPDDRRRLRHQARRRRRQHHRPGQRHHPRRPDHVLPAQGRQQVPTSRRRGVQSGAARRRRRLPRRLLPDPARLRQGSQHHVRHRRRWSIGLAALLLGLPLVFTIMVVNFIGGYIPYIGAFLGGGLAVIVALGDGGLPDAAIMLVVVLASNLLLENFVEPKVMGRSLDIHPLVVLVVTALGGLLGGIVGLLLAVPAYVVARSAITRFRSRGIAEMVADRAQPTVDRLLQ